MLEGAGAEELGEGRLANAGMACENERWHSFCVPITCWRRWYCRGCKVDPADCRLPPPWLSNRNRHVNSAGRNRHTYRLSLSTDRHTYHHHTNTSSSRPIDIDHTSTINHRIINPFHFRPLGGAPSTSIHNVIQRYYY